MKKLFVTAALALSALGAQAQETALRPYLGFFFTGGGDTLTTVPYSDGSTETIRAGGLLDMKGGLEYLFTPQFSLRGTVGYHVDSSTARNGDVRFSRFPFELLAVFHPGEPFHLGVGLRQSTDARLNGSGAGASVGSTQFDAETGLVLEGEWQFAPNIGVALRAVKERYKVKGTSTYLDGNHIGAGLNFHF